MLRCFKNSFENFLKLAISTKIGTFGKDIIYILSLPKLLKSVGNLKMDFLNKIRGYIRGRCIGEGRDGVPSQISF